MAQTIQFTLTEEQMAHFRIWRAQLDAAPASPVEGILFSFLVGTRGEIQLIVRPSTEADWKLMHILREDGTSDPCAPHEEILIPYDTLGFASVLIP